MLTYEIQAYGGGQWVMNIEHSTGQTCIQIISYQTHLQFRPENFVSQSQLIVPAAVQRLIVEQPFDAGRRATWVNDRKRKWLKNKNTPLDSIALNVIKCQLKWTDLLPPRTQNDRSNLQSIEKTNRAQFENFRPRWSHCVVRLASHGCVFVCWGRGGVVWWVVHVKAGDVKAGKGADDDVAIADVCCWLAYANQEAQIEPKVCVRTISLRSKWFGKGRKDFRISLVFFVHKMNILIWFRFWITISNSCSTHIFYFQKSTFKWLKW